MEIWIAILALELLVMIPLWPRIPPERKRPYELEHFSRRSHYGRGDPGPIETEVELRMTALPPVNIDLSHRTWR